MLITVTVMAGATISSALQEGIEICRAVNDNKPITVSAFLERRSSFMDIKVTDAPVFAEKVGLEFEFNGITMRMTVDSNVDYLMRDFYRALYNYIEDRTVGPYPKPELSAEELASDARKAAAKEALMMADRAERIKRDESKRNAVNSELAETEPIQVHDTEKWERLKREVDNGYDSGVIDYAERWARLMQRELATGVSLEAIAESCSQRADLSGITGYMHNSAVLLLAVYWIHGEELRLWHNNKYGDQGQIANQTGEVINSAILQVRTR